MACKIRQENNIKGICIKNQTLKLLQYADDTNGILQDLSSAKCFLLTIKEFGQYSGLLLNAKTECLWIGSNRDNKTKPLGILWPDHPLRILGIYVSYDEDACYKCNFESRLNKAKQIINMWSMRNLTMYGRKQIIKTFIVSQFMYVCSVLATPKDFVKKVTKMIFKFVWKAKTERLKRAILIKDYTCGGLEIPDFDTMIKTARLKWVEKLDNGNNQTWKWILNAYLSKLNIDMDILLYSSYSLNMLNSLGISRKSIPPFYYELLQLWSVNGETTTANRSTFIWYKQRTVHKK